MNNKQMIAQGTIPQLEKINPHWKDINTRARALINKGNKLIFEYKLAKDGKKYTAILEYGDGEAIQPLVFTKCVVCPNCGAKLFSPYLLMMNHYKGDYHFIGGGNKLVDCKFTFIDRNSNIPFITQESTEICNLLEAIYAKVEALNNRTAKFTRAGVCPICSKNYSLSSYKQDCYKTSAKFGTLTQLYNDTDRQKKLHEGFSLCYSMITTRRCEAGIKAGNHDSQAFLSSAASFDQQDVTSPKGNEISQNTEKLKRYLYALIEVETGIIACKKRLEYLFPVVGKLKAEHDISKTLIHNENSDLYIRYYEDLRDNVIEAEDNDITFLTMLFNSSAVVPFRPVPPPEPVYKQSNFFNRRKIEQENASIRQKFLAMQNKYKKDTEEYNQKILAFKERYIEGLNITLQELKREKISSESDDIDCATIVNIEFEEAKKFYKKLCKDKAELYNIGVVFSKYRNITIISKMYEYLMAGRCSTLDGEHGAYNLYESESRSDVIIEKLDTVIDKLDDIKASQQLIYKQLKMVNRSLETIAKKTDAVITSVDAIQKAATVIAYNTEKTAFYAKITATITTADYFLG